MGVKNKMIKELILKLFGIVMIKVVNIKEGDTLVFQLDKDFVPHNLEDFERSMRKMFKCNIVWLQGASISEVIRKDGK